MSGMDDTPPPTGADAIDHAERAWAGDVSAREARVYALATRMLAVARMIEHSFEVDSRRDGLAIGEALLLDALRRLGPPYQTSATHLRSTFLISLAGVGKRIGRLEQLGLIAREVDPADRRVQVVRLTDKGLDLLHATERRQTSPHTRAIRSLGDDDLDALSGLLRKLHDAIAHEIGD